MATPTNSIRAVLLDVGGVLFKGRVTPMSSWIHDKFGTDIEVAREVLGQTLFQADLGVLNFREYYYRCARALGISLPYAQFRTMFLERFGTPIAGTRQLVRRLRRRETPIIALSNMAPFTWRVLKRKYNVMELFDETVLSYEHNVCKPDEKIYRIALDGCGCEPNETVFIDDTEKNVAAAAKLGIRGIVFKSSIQLEQELRDLHLF